MYFDNDDLLAVHALSRASFRVIFDLHPEGDRYKAVVNDTINYLGWANFNQITNFLKHADRDPEGEIEEPSEMDVQVGIGFAAMLYRQLTGELTPEMKVFHTWMQVNNPDKFPSVREPEWEFEEDYLAANEYLKQQDRKTRMVTGKVFLKLIKDEKAKAN